MLVLKPTSVAQNRFSGVATQEMPGASGDIEGDLFGKLYTYDELLTVERPRKAPSKPDWARDLTVPDHWPKDGTTVDPGNWVFWLPEGWGQGIKPTSGGKTLKCFVSPPPMKRLFHKPDIIKYCQKMGWPGLKEEEAKEAAEKQIKTVHDSIPTWPEWDLPKDWRIGFKQLPSGPHKIYIPPGQDEGFLYHKTCVQTYLSVGKAVTLFAESKPMAQRSAEADAKKPNNKKKRRLAPATLDAYVDCPSLIIVKIAVQSSRADIVSELVEAGVPNAEEIASTATQTHSLLMARGFPAGTEVVTVCRAASDSVEKIVSHVCGQYYSLNVAADRPTYQKLQLSSACNSGIACQNLYISWSTAFEGCWKVGVLGNDTAGLVINKDDLPSPSLCKSAWRVHQEGASGDAPP